jgi:ParB/RepB/Spo0J family partition protein
MSEKPTFERIPLPQLLPADPDLRIRAGTAYQTDFDRTVSSIREHGILVPLLVYREGDTRKYRIIDGTTRFYGAIASGVEEAPALVYAEKPDAKQLDFAKIIVNDLRSDLTKMEKLQAMLDMMKRHNLSLRELARQCFKSPSQLSKDFGAIRRAIESVKEMMLAGKLGARQTWAISRLPAEKQPEMANRAVNWSAETTEDKVNEALGGKKPKKKVKTIKVKGAVARLMEGVDGAKALAAELSRLIKNPELFGL